MRKTGTTFLLTIVLFCLFSGHCLAEMITEKQYYFFGNNNQFLAEVITKKSNPIIKNRLAPKIPNEISRYDAIRLWRGEKVAPQKNCEREFLSFTNGVHAVKKCEEIIAKLAPTKKEPLNISLTKKFTVENSAIDIWPFFGIGGMLSIALIFIFKGAPARFMAEYCGTIICFVIAESAFRFFFGSGAGFVVALMLSWCFIYPIHNELATRWTYLLPNLDSYKYKPIGNSLQIWGMIISPPIFLFIPMGITKFTVGIDFVLFLVLWSIILTTFVFLAHRFISAFRQEKR